MRINGLPWISWNSRGKWVGNKNVARYKNWMKMNSLGVRHRHGGITVKAKATF